MPGCSVEVGTTRASTLGIKLALRVNIETSIPVLTVGEEFARNRRMDKRTVVSIFTVGPKATSLNSLIAIHFLSFLCTFN